MKLSYHHNPDTFKQVSNECFHEKGYEYKDELKINKNHIPINISFRKGRKGIIYEN